MTSPTKKQKTNQLKDDIVVINGVVDRYLCSSSSDVKYIIHELSTGLNKLKNKTACIEVQNELIQLLHEEYSDDDSDDITNEEYSELVKLFTNSSCIKSKQKRADYHITSEIDWKLPSLEGDDYIKAKLFYRGDGESGDGNTNWSLYDKVGKVFDCNRFIYSKGHIPNQQLLDILKLKYEGNASRVVELLVSTTNAVSQGYDDNDDENEDEDNEENDNEDDINEENDSEGDDDDDNN
jgi:hypothetical protein